jgi:cold shock CspA family protein
MAARVYGTLKHWNDERGFGFIRRDDQQPDLFVGAGAFRHAEIEPRAGMKLAFAIGMDRDDRLRAADLVVDEAEAA